MDVAGEFLDYLWDMQRSTKRNNKETKGGSARKKKGTECRFCGPFRKQTYCSCGDGPALDDRSLYARLKVSTEGYEKHYAVSPFHAETNRGNDKDFYPLWKQELERLEQTL